MSRVRKVHRFGFVRASWRFVRASWSREIKLSQRSETYTHCGAWLRAGSTGLVAVGDVTFTHLPIEAQCRNCRLNEPRALRSRWQRVTEATEEERTIAELFCHAFGSFCTAVDAAGTHEERGCYFRFDAPITDRACWCGCGSWLDRQVQLLWLQVDGDKLLRPIGWWPDHEWRNQAGDEYISARVHAPDLERVP